MESGMSRWSGYFDLRFPGGRSRVKFELDPGHGHGEEASMLTALTFAAALSVKVAIERYVQENQGKIVRELVEALPPCSIPHCTQNPPLPEGNCPRGEAARSVFFKRRSLGRLREPR
jgi:hypothetical protein